MSGDYLGGPAELAIHQAEFGDPLSILNRLRKFSELFLQDGLNYEFAYLFGLKDV